MHEAAATPAWVLLAYLISGVCFILALRGLSSPESSRRGNLNLSHRSSGRPSPRPSGRRSRAQPRPILFSLLPSRRSNNLAGSGSVPNNSFSSALKAAP